jgi:signal transduction histidine kinase
MATARILVAEDEHSIAEALKFCLEQCGYSVVGPVASGEDAVHMAGEEMPDLVLMDIRLNGGMDGIEAAKIIQQRFQIPIVYLTAHADDATIGRAQQTSPYGYLIKPFRDRELGVTVEIALQRRQLEQRLQDSEDQLRTAQKLEAAGQLAGGIAHEINNLMTVVIGYGDILLSQLDDETLKSKVRTMKAAGERAAAISRQLIAFSRKQILKPVRLSLNEIVASLSETLRVLFPDDVALSRVTDPALNMVKADPAQVEQVIMNLALNARDAMTDGGRFVLETHNVTIEAVEQSPIPPGNYVQLVVSDNGHGMDEHTRAHIFEPFFTTKEVGKGRGLGLAVTHGVVTQSGGYITVESELGSGTTFRIYLPPAAQQSMIAAIDEVHSGTETVLLVDDEQEVRALVRDGLQRCGYTVFEAATGAEALQICQAGIAEIDLVLTDVVMPQMSGPKLIQEMRRVRPGLKALFMSGYTETCFLWAGDGAPPPAPANCITKPFALTELTRRIRGALDA